MRFQVLLTPLTGVLFTFPSRYLSTIGLLVVFSLTRWSSQIQAGFHVSRLTWVPDQRLHLDFSYGTVTHYGPTFQTVRLSRFHLRVIPTGPRNPRRTRVHPVWAFPLSLATTNGITACFLFLRVLRCFTSPGLPRTAMNSPYASTVLPVEGFPIRTSTDQSLVGGSPWLIAATHVLRRLQEPRHPPHTLSSLVTLNSDLPSLAARATPSRGRDPDPASGTWNS
jgi:hypothetical protein